MLGLNGKLLDFIYPVGSIYISIQDTNPSVFFGGTWERIAKGKTLVGVDENDSDFNASSKTGGEKTHTLTVNEMPSHNHSITIHRTAGSGTMVAQSSGTGGDATGSNWVIGNTGENQPHNNMQPYYTCYIFVRTA